MIKRKPKLYLVSDKITKKRYDTFIVFLCDGSIFEYKLNEWNIYKDSEWVEAIRLDDTIMECFYVNNIMRVKFVSSKAKGSTTEKPTLQPVA